MEPAKIIDYKDINKLAKKGKIVLVGGCFDILHYGHIEFMRQAKQQGDLLVIALESDEFIIHKKKRKPFHTQAQRASVLAALRYTDVIIKLPLLNKDEDYFNLVKQIKPSVIAVTEGDPYVEKKTEQAKTIQASVVVCPLVTSLSTTRIIDYATLSGNRSAFRDEGTT